LQPSPFVAVTATRQFIVLPSVTLILHGQPNDSAKLGSCFTVKLIWKEATCVSAAAALAEGEEKHRYPSYVFPRLSPLNNDSTYCSRRGQFAAPEMFFKSVGALAASTRRQGRRA
jgi:hypothetical protein